MVYKTHITKKEQIADNTVEIHLPKPKNFKYFSGQYAQIGVEKLLYPDNKGKSRVFSMTSTPNSEEITFAFRETGSGFKKTLTELSETDVVYINGPYGFLYFPPKNKKIKKYIFIAGGIGIAPHISMIRFLNEEKLDLQITLLYSSKNKSNMPYIEELEKISKTNKNLVLKTKTGRIDRQFIEQNIDINQTYKWHISGPPAMVDMVKNELSLLGIENNIHTEGFIGY